MTINHNIFLFIYLIVDATFKFGRPMAELQCMVLSTSGTQNCWLSYKQMIILGVVGCTITALDKPKTEKTLEMIVNHQLLTAINYYITIIILYYLSD